MVTRISVIDFHKPINKETFLNRKVSLFINCLRIVDMKKACGNRLKSQIEFEFKLINDVN